MVTVRVFPRQTLKILLCFVAVLVVMYLVTESISYYGGHPTQLGFAHQFDLSDENNLPTWFSSFALSLCSILLFLIWNAGRLVKARYAFHWLALSMIFMWLSLDEAASLHEMMGKATRALFHQIMPTHALFQPRSYLPVAWVIPGGLLVVLVAVVFRRFLASLPQPTRRLFYLAGLFYVGGAMGMELLGAIYWGYYGHDMIYSMSVVWEEGLEMLGILVFLYSLLGYVRDHIGPIEILVEPD